MFETSILVLLYNKEIIESKTIITLLESDVQYPNARLVIWNNGPKNLTNVNCDALQKLSYDVVLQETLNNESLSVIYNRFIAENNAEKFILLDDDSALCSSYINESSKSGSATVSMPLISFEGEIQSPKINGRPFLSSDVGVPIKSKVITIGSGLVIGNEIINVLKDKYATVFDERFYLYGVDTTFCLRLFAAGLTNSIKVISGFPHSLSRLEKENTQTTAFRKLERSYDVGLRLRYYYPLRSSAFKLLRITLGSVRRKVLFQPTNVLLKPLIKAFLKGSHYRS